MNCCLLTDIILEHFVVLWFLFVWYVDKYHVRTHTRVCTPLYMHVYAPNTNVYLFVSFTYVIPSVSCSSSNLVCPIISSIRQQALWFSNLIWWRPPCYLLMSFVYCCFKDVVIAVSAVLIVLKEPTLSSNLFYITFFYF